MHYLRQFALICMLAIFLASASFAQSGSHLNSWSSDPGWVFDSSSEIPSSVQGQNVTIVGVGVFVSDNYIASFDLGSQGVHNILHFSSLSTHVSNASWSVGGSANAPPATFTSGSTLTSWNVDGSWVFDPNHELDSSLAGKTITITGAGANNGSFSSDRFIASYDMGSQGVHNALHCPNINTYGALTGVAWSQGGTALVLPVAPVVSGYSGPVRVLLIGDSITFNEAQAVQGSLVAEYPHASLVIADDVGLSGTTTTDWLPGSSNYNNAVAAGNASGDTVASIMLGTNDAKTTPENTGLYDAHLTQIVAALKHDIPSLKFVVLQEQPYIVPGAFNQFDASSDTALQSYVSSYSSISGAEVGASGMYAYFQQNTQFLTGGLHPNAEGSSGVLYFWEVALAPYIQSAGGGTSLDSILPSHSLLSPNTQQQFSVSGLPMGVSVTSWSISGIPPPGVTLSLSGLLSYGKQPVSSSTMVNFVASLSNGLSVPGVTTLENGETFDPTQAATLFGGVDTGSGSFVTQMIKGYGWWAILISVAIGGVCLVWAWSRRTLM
jgi:lysophospholipase L1-like esterase